MKKLLLSALLLGCFSPAFADITVDNVQTMESLSENASVSANGELHLQSATPLAAGVKVNLSAPGAAVVFEGLRRSEVRDQALSSVTVEGRAFDPAKDRIAIYGTGTIIIADGEGTPLTIYTGENQTGKSMVCEQDRYYRGTKVATKDNFLEQIMLEEFDNNIHSFRLRRGYSATFATQADGTGYSCNFVASDGDIVFDQIPAGLEFTSFIRVCRYDWIGKRGWCGEDDASLTRSAWYYTWGASSESYDDYEFVPMRHNKWWDGWDKIGSRLNASCVLGYNEPDHTDQSDLSPNYAITQWPEMLKSGLRLGSPAPDAISKSWLSDFIAMADSLHFRVDFVATHMYWDSQDPDALCTRISNLCKNIYNGRTMWITEWNNGANWTSESWPDKEGTRLDAEFNVLLDENGKQTTVKRPHTEANSAKQTEWLGRALKAFDECPWLERHSFYNWVEDARSVVLDGKLTPAGKVFADFYSRPGYTKETAYVHEFGVGAPLPLGIEQNSFRVRVDLLDTNGEAAEGYIVERRIAKKEWVQIAYIKGGYDTKSGADYKYGSKIAFLDRDLVGGNTEYRFKAVSYRDPEETSGWSRRASIKVVAGLSDVKVEEFKVYGSNGNLMIESDTEGTAEIYRADGTLVRTVSYGTDDATVVDGLGRGLYIVKGKKVIL